VESLLLPNWIAVIITYPSLNHIKMWNSRSIRRLFQVLVIYICVYIYIYIYICTHTWPFLENRFCIRIGIACWWHWCQFQAEISEIFV